MPESERYLLHIFAIIVYECITKDKVSLIPLWLRMFQSVQVIEEQPNSFSMWQIKLLSSQISRKLNGASNANPLLSVDSMLAIKQKTSAILDKWENGIYLTHTYIHVHTHCFVNICFLSFCRYKMFIYTLF